MKCLSIFCGGDIKLSVMVVLRNIESLMRKNKSQERNITSQKVILCKCKHIARDFGKRFGGTIFYFFNINSNRKPLVGRLVTDIVPP